MELQTAAERTPWHAPGHVTLERDGLVVLLDPEGPNWIATDSRGARILSWLDGQSSLEEVTARYSREIGVELPKAWLHVNRFVREAERRGFASPEPLPPAPYAGRASYLTPRLRELWLHTNSPPTPSSPWSTRARHSASGASSSPAASPSTARTPSTSSSG